MSCFCLRLQKDIVKTLDFRHCSLNFVPDEIYDYDETLEELYLDSNNIKDLPRSLFHCEFLHKLSVCDNDLCAIPSAVATLVNLEQLDISKNGIVELPDSIKCCKNLSLVEISVNPLGKLPEGFTQLVNLTQLYLNDTLLNYLPANFGRLIKLTVLELRENRLKALPRSMARLTELERLDLGMNEFRQLPEVIGFFTKLTELWVDSNKLTAIPSAIGNLKKLVYFDASCNRIESLPVEVEGLDSLTDLHLSKNYLQELPKTIGQLSNLQNLKLDCNQISFLPYSIGGLVSLEELILTVNDLEELPPSIGLLRKLTHLNADQNMLLDLPSELGSCSAISLLSLHSNLLTTLPDEIGHISSLSVVNLSNNQLRYLPYKFTKLKKLQALWLSENQSKPMIPLQSEMREDLGKRVLTCFLFPQQHREPEEDTYQSDGENIHASVLEEQRLSRRQIAFDVSESDSEHNLKRTPTPYPKEGIKRKILSTSQGSSSKSGRSRGQRVNILPNYPSVDTSTRHGQQGSPREGKARQPRSPGSPISDSLHLFQADKEKMAKDKARLRGSFSSVNRQDSDTESVASSTRERVVGRREMRARMDQAAMSDTEAFIQSPVWSHTGGTNANKQPAAPNSKSPRSGNKSHSRGYESDRGNGSRTPIGSPKVPQIQVRHDRAPRSGGVGYSRGYESDQVDKTHSPLDAYVHRREQNDLEVNRNCNAASTSVDGRQSWCLSHQRSSGYSTDPEHGYVMPPTNDRDSRMVPPTNDRESQMVPPTNDRELRMADVKQKRDEMLPPPYYRVRQLRAGDHSKPNNGTPRKQPKREQLQSVKDYGWIDGQSTPEGQVTNDTPHATHNPTVEISSKSQDKDKRFQLVGNNSQTPNISSSRNPHFSATPVRSRGDPTAYSDTELASGRRKVKPKSVELMQREATTIRSNPKNNRTLNNSKEQVSPVFGQAHSGQDVEPGYQSRKDPKNDRTLNDNKEQVSPAFDQTQNGQYVKSRYQLGKDRTFHDQKERVSPAFDKQQQINGNNYQGQDGQVSDSFQRYSTLFDQENHNAHHSNAQQPIRDQEHPTSQADFTSIGETRQYGRNYQKVTDTQNGPLPEQKNWQTLVTEDGNREYLDSLEGRRRQSATLPAELSRNLNPRGSHSLPKDVVNHQQRPNELFRPNVGDQQKSSTLSRSEVRGEMDGGDGIQRNFVRRVVSDRHTNVGRSDKKKRLHGGAPNYAASEPELRQLIQQDHPTGEPINQDTGRPPVEPRCGVADPRRSQSPVFQDQHRGSLRESDRFPFGLTSSTPSVDGGSRPQSSAGSRPHSPSDGICCRSRPGSSTEIQQSQRPHQHSDSESHHLASQHRDPRDANLYRPNMLPLKPNDRQYDSDYVLEKPNYGCRHSDASSVQQQQSKTNHSSDYPIPYHGGRRDSLRGSLLTPIVGDTQHQDRRGIFTADLNPRSLQSQGLPGQSSRVPCPDLWPQDSSGYASDQNDQGWKRASCSTPTSSVFQGLSSPPMWRPGSDVTPPDHRPRHPSSDRHDKPPATKRLPVVIYKNPGLGFSITGGKDAPGNPFKPFDWGIFVTKIQPGGPADGILRPGDKLLEVNGRSYDNILHDEAVRMLRKSNPVSVVVQRYSDDT